MEPLSAMINRRLVLPSTKDDYLIVEKAYLYDLLSIKTRQIYVDFDWYTEKYPDVLSAIKDGVIQDPGEHYARFGYYEHRMPYRIAVDEEWYLEQYPDVREAVGARVFDSGQVHFDERGYREGRMPYPNFSLTLKSE